MVGDFAVGKTSLVARYVHSSFDQSYLTTVGVKVDTKLLTLPSGDELKMVLWDIAGKSAFARIDHNYLRDAAAYLLVADGSRAETLGSALGLQQEVETQLGQVPFGLVLNKSDLDDRWSLDAGLLSGLAARGWSVSHTSALNGAGVEETFAQLGRRLSLTL